MDNLSGLNLTFLTAGFASIGIFWNNIKVFLSRISSFVIVRVEMGNHAKDLFMNHAYKNFKLSPSGERRFWSETSFIRPKNYIGIVPYEMTGRSLLFFDGIKPLFVSQSVDKDGRLQGELKLSYIRGTFDLESILIKSSNDYNDRHHAEKEVSNRYYVEKVFGISRKKERNSNETPDDPGKALSSSDSIDVESNRYLGFKKEELGAPRSAVPFNNLAYPDYVKDFETEIRRWKKSENWYKSKNIPWRFGAGLFGPPGTGKTSFVRAIGQDLDIPIHIYDLTTMSNEELVKAWKRSLSCSPCIVLFEDIDRIFDKDKNIKSSEREGGGLTLDCLLNCINGIEPADGILIFVTANDITKLDPALGVPDESGKSTRPGRLDRAVYFGVLDKSNRETIAKRILSDCPELIEETVELGDNETGAQFENRCAKLALQHYWGDAKLYTTNGVKSLGSVHQLTQQTEQV